VHFFFAVILHINTLRELSILNYKDRGRSAT
jgi:hypothetical protein